MKARFPRTSTHRADERPVLIEVGARRADAMTNTEDGSDFCALCTNPLTGGPPLH